MYHSERLWFWLQFSREVEDINRRNSNMIQMIVRNSIIAYGTAVQARNSDLQTYEYDLC